MDSVVELIKKIEDRPAMYISKNYISCLKSFLDGWYLRDTSNIVDIHLIGEFQDWLVDKYKIKTSHSWNDIILFYSQDEINALDSFFKEFNNFLEIHNKENKATKV
jgi:hypothetical protein